MPDTFIHPTAVLKESEVGTVKVFRNAVVSQSTMGDGCSLGDDSIIERCVLGKNVVINRRCYINDSFIGKYTYTGINTTMNWTRIGRFCSLGRNVDIGGIDHDYHKVTTMPEFRFRQIKQGGGKLPQALEEDEYCEIGNDVWIAAGALVLHKVRVGDGAVIGAGAVVTHDVPPYAIVAGTPAKIIGYRCSKEHISALLEIKWWNWKEDVLLEYMDRLMGNDITDETIDWMQKINKAGEV